MIDDAGIHDFGSGRRAPFGVPVVPEVRTMTRPRRGRLGRSAVGQASGGAVRSISRMDVQPSRTLEVSW